MEKKSVWRKDEVISPSEEKKVYKSMHKSKDKNCISRRVLSASLSPKTTRDNNEPELKETLVGNSLPLVVWHRLNTDEVSQQSCSFEGCGHLPTGFFCNRVVLLMSLQINYKFLWSYYPILVCLYAHVTHVQMSMVVTEWMFFKLPLRLVKLSTKWNNG